MSEAEITRFAAWVQATRSTRVTESYDELWRWSVDDVEGFWAAIVEYFEITFDGALQPVLDGRAMPGARWFGDMRVSYAEHVFRGKDDDAVALRAAAEAYGERIETWTWARLRDETTRVATGLRALGVRRGDRVAAYLPNVPETIAAFLACASIGAIWSAAAPEFGADSVVDRFAQIEPKVLLAVDGYRYGGKDFDRREDLARIRTALPTVEHLVVLPHLGLSGMAGALAWEDLTAQTDELRFARVPFDHPLWILYSSGTTGLPKAIVHGHGGMLLEHLKVARLHVDAGPEDRVLWFTTTGWMMWNFLVGVLLTPASIVLYDGTPAGDALWRLVEETETTVFGTSAAFVAACQKGGIEPRGEGRTLAALRAIGSTGSPLAPEGFDWVAEHCGQDTWLFSMSGGTDMCTAFVGGVPTLPVHRGELQGPALGARVEAWDAEGRPVPTGQVGELVIVEPMPCMPVAFWGDEDGTKLRDAYFAVYPGVWRHGDWIELTEHGGAIIHGRSDSTINRGGIRMGTAEIYRAVLADEDVVDALVVDLPRPETDGWMPLFVVLRAGATLDDELVGRIKRQVRSYCSPRHVPDEVIQIAAVPRTLSGKPLEVPIKRILMGEPPEAVVSLGALADSSALVPFVERGRRATI